MPDGPLGCMNNDDCGSDTPVCNLGMCVQCTQDDQSACTGSTPICSSANICRGCEAHTECPASGVCVSSDGMCAAEDQVAYVAPGGAGVPPTCSKAAPCADLADALDADKPYIKVAAGTIKDSGDDETLISGRTVSIFGEPSTVIDRDGDGSILVVRHSGGGSTNVSIYDLTISGASGAGSHGISLEPNGGNPMLFLARVVLTNNEGFGIAASGGQLTIAASTISNNDEGGISRAGSMGSLSLYVSTISGNTGGGVVVAAGSFAIVGNVFFNNGNNSSTVGGLAINAAQNSSNRLEFNSFSKNTVQVGAAGIRCDVASFTARNNIMSTNSSGDTTAQWSGACSHSHSIALPGPLPSGSMNSDDDPMFVNMNAGNLHVLPTSPARDKADPSTDLLGAAAFDIDGDARTSPADIGADQVP
ncbi:MAG: hypothetical protein AB7O24_08720 [Kofleriaceae bacterium]